jgi:hypothetical protein
MGFRWRCWWPGQATDGENLAVTSATTSTTTSTGNSLLAADPTATAIELRPSLQMWPLLLIGSSCLILLPSGGVLGTGRNRGTLGVWWWVEMVED